MAVIINLPKKTGIDETIIDNKIGNLKSEYFKFVREASVGEYIWLPRECSAFLLVCGYPKNIPYSLKNEPLLNGMSYIDVYIIIQIAQIEDYEFIPIVKSEKFTIEKLGFNNGFSIRADRWFTYCLTRLG